MTNVIELQTVTTLDVPADRVLNKALEANLDQAVVIGFDDDGELYFASSVADGGSVLWLMELAKKRLMEIGDS